MAATMMPVSRLAPKLTGRFGTRTVCASGLVLVAVGLTILAQLGTHTAYPLLAAGVLGIGIGMGTAMTPATSAITEALPAAQQGVGSALNDLSPEVGGALGIAVIGSLLTATHTSQVNVTGLPAQIATKVKGSFAIAAHLPAPIPDRAHAAFTAALNGALLTAAGAALVAAITVVVLLSRREPTTTSPPRADHDGELAQVWADTPTAGLRCERRADAHDAHAWARLLAHDGAGG